MKPSVTILGLVVSFLGFLFQQTGVNVTPGAIDGFLEVVLALVQLGGLILAVFGRFRQGDLNFFGFKKPPNA